MDAQELLEKYPNHGRVRERRRHSFEDHPDLRHGTIAGTSLGGAIMKPVSRRGGNQPMLNVHVNWDDGTESTVHHSSLEPLDA